MELPAELSAAIERELEGVNPRRLRAAVERVSERYRAAMTGRGNRYIEDADDVPAYVAYRMAATYAATRAAMVAAEELLGDWQPASILDVGAGTGAATWAALDVWPTIERATLIDADPGMIEAGQRLAASSTYPALRDARWVKSGVGSLPSDARVDLVVASYVHNEIPRKERAGFLSELWERAGQVLIVVDPGTPRSFEGLREARTSLIEMDAQMVAPCPHARACPMAGGDWCHFAARFNRSRIHRLVKSADKSYEDEKFSYVVVSREPVEPARSRVIRHPLIRKGQVTVELCAQSGLIQQTYSRRKSGADYRDARDLRWGDQWNADVS